MKQKIRVAVEVSARHVHLSQKDTERLFGRQHRLRAQRSISQSGQFACRERVELHGPAGEFTRVGIVGPERQSSQVELSVTDCRRLGIKPCFHVSGHTSGAPKLTVAGPGGKVKIPAIVPLRHIHISDTDARRYKLRQGQKVSVRIGGVRGLVFNSVVVRVHPSFRFRLHLDTDEGNAIAAGMRTRGELIADS